MITESFLNTCFSLLFNNKSKIKKTQALYRDVIDILDFSASRETYEIPLPVQSKLDFLKKISTMLLNGKTIDSVKDSISLSEKFKQYQDFLDLKTTEDLTESSFQDFLRQIRIRKKICALFQNYDELNDVLDQIKDGSFDSIDDLVEDYESTIKTLYTNINESPESILFKDFEGIVDEVNGILREASKILPYHYMMVFKLYFNLYMAAQTQ